MAEFVHLHNHSDFSLLRASTTVKGLVKTAKSMKMPAIALTDDGNLFGALRFYKECKSDKETPIKPIIGCDFFVAPQSMHDKSAGEFAARYSRIVLLAQNEAGYKNLIELSSLGYTQGFYYRPRIDKELIAKYSSNLIALSGGMGGEIPQLISRNRITEAKEVAAFYRDLYGPEQFYLELCDHGLPEESIINKTLIEFSADLGIGVVAANDTYYPQKSDALAHDVLLCIGQKRKRNEAGRFKFSSQEFYIKSVEEMEALFGHIPQALSNTLKIAEMCNVNIKLPGPLLPDYEIPPSFETEGRVKIKPTLERLAQKFASETPEVQARLRELVSEYFVYETEKGFFARYGANPKPEVIDRLDYELYIIIKMGFVGYFLIVWDFIAWAKKQDIPVGPGRGSGAGSIVAYSLTITDIEPLRYNLLFERFLNPERISMPDFDVDFCFERRQEVIDYVTDKYGKEKVGQIITFGTLKTRAVIKDVARALDMSFDESNELVKNLPKGPPADKLHLSDLLADTLHKDWVDKGFAPNAEAVKQIYSRGGIYQELFDISMKLEGLNRHASTHAAGVVIGKDVLTEYVPLFRDPKTGAISTQYTMDLLEECGLVKMDFLGLKTLTLIKNTEGIIRASRDPNFTTEVIDEHDPATYAMLGKGNSAAVFQFDGEGMQSTLEKAKPTSIEDLIALNALYRPGPQAYIPQFVDSKWGRQAISYPHPSLEAILKETYGVIVYQEQVMQAVQIVGGYSLGGADILRRAMGKKKPEEMAKQRVIFREGSKKTLGLSETKADEIYDILEKFAGYGFNKSHAAAYSLLAYRTAFLKANYPAEFMAANLTNEINNPDDFTLYLSEARSMDLKVDAPEINTSHKDFTVANGHIVFGLMGIKGIGSAVVDDILNARQSGPFKSFTDFLDRVDLRVCNRKTLETLILSGAMRGICPKRKPTIEALETLFAQAQSRKQDQKSGQTNLFGDDSPIDQQNIDLDGEEFDLMELLKHEKEILGHYFSGHPLDAYRADWERATTLDLSRPEAAKRDQEYHLVAMVSNIRLITTKKGKQMAIVLLEDYNGNIETVLFPEAMEEHGKNLQVEQVFGLSGTIDTSRGQPQLVLNAVVDPSILPEKDAAEIHLRLKPGFYEREDILLALRGELLSHAGKCPVYVHVEHNGETILKVSSQLAVRSLPEVLSKLRNHEAIEEVWKVYPAMGKAMGKKAVFVKDLADEDDTVEVDNAETEVPIEVYE